MTKRQYKITIEIDCENIAKGKKELGDSVGALGYKVIDVSHVPQARTETQNNALHLWFTQLANELNEKHFDMRAIIREGVAMPWSCYSVKEYIFKPLLKQHYGKKSTTELFRTKEIDLLYDVINREIIKRTEGQVEVPPWPCRESLEEQAINKLNNTSL